MKGFSSDQLKKLTKKLDRSHICLRQTEGRTLSYIEGWFAVSEANAIFGFAGWDRAMVHCERVYERSKADGFACGYHARVRIQVRAGDTMVTREGSGFGHAHALNQSEAHDRALKAAETDATKRALATFGNRFGLSLYDKLQAGVTALDARGTGQPGNVPLVRGDQSAPAAGLALTLYGASASPLATNLSPEGFASGLRQLIEAASTIDQLQELQNANATGLADLRIRHPRLKNSRGKHYADILTALIAAKNTRLSPQPAPSASPVPAVADQGSSDRAAGPRRSTAAVAGGSVAAAPQVGEPTATSEPGSETLTARQPAATPAERAPVVLPAIVNGSGEPSCHEARTPGGYPDNGPAPSYPAIDLAQARPSRLSMGLAVEKNALAFGSERRIRNKAHLALVGSRPCAICEEVPCHAHHLTVAQRRGLSLKVSDEYTVPLCAIHHNELHLTASERSWWRTKGIDPLPLALALWTETLRAATGETAAS